MSHRPLRVVTLATALALCAAVAAAQQPAPNQNARVVVATVEGQPIYQDEIVDLFHSLPPQVQQQGLPAVYPNLLDQAINAEMLAIFGRREQLADDPEVKARLKEAEDSIIRGVYLNRLIQVNMSEERLRHRYDELVKERPQEEEVRARHILVPDEAQARSIIKELQGGADFAQLAAKHSRDGSARQGGDLGYFVRHEMVKPFSDAAFGLSPGSITTTPVRTDFGWHIIKVEDKRVLTPPPYEQAKRELVQDVSNQLAQAIVEQLREQAKVQTFNFDGTPASGTPSANLQ